MRRRRVTVESPLLVSGSFGPLELDTRAKHYEYITSTPKAGWTNTDMLGS
jgi:hypothetical protein